MTNSVKKEVEELIKLYNLNYSIEEFRDKVSWPYVSKNYILSEQFIREFEGLVSWYYISMCQTLSENFIREFKNEVEWSNISAFQVFSNKFYQEFKDKISVDYLKNNKNIDMSIKIKIKSGTKPGTPINNRFELLDLRL